MSLVQSITATIGSQAFSCKIQAFLQNKYWFSIYKESFHLSTILS